MPPQPAAPAIPLNRVQHRRPGGRDRYHRGADEICKIFEPAHTKTSLSGHYSGRYARFFQPFPPPMPRDDSVIPASYAPSFAWTAVAPAVFVVLWSTGFVAAKAGLPYPQPLTFLTPPFAILPLPLLIPPLPIP